MSKQWSGCGLTAQNTQLVDTCNWIMLAVVIGVANNYYALTSLIRACFGGGGGGGGVGIIKEVNYSPHPDKYHACAKIQNIVIKLFYTYLITSLVACILVWL